MLKEPIYINSIASISALGCSKEEIWANYLQSKPLFQLVDFNSFEHWVSFLNESVNNDLKRVAHNEHRYKALDKTVLMALFVSRIIGNSTLQGKSNFGINFGSSRGATKYFEDSYQHFLEQNSVSTYTSPSTTLGNISSWVAHDLQTSGPEISHSITCSTGLHAVLNGIAWIQAGFTSDFLVGASEAPLTPYTLAQLRALKVYTQENSFPNRSLDLDKIKNTMVLGEAAAALHLSKISNNYIGKIIGIGFATEVLSSGTSISTEAICFQKSMKMALTTIDKNSIDAIVMHAPGTIQGDLTELKAIKNIFQNNLPLLTSNKWIVGHTFATSGLLSLELALLMLEKQKFIASPFYPQQLEKPLHRIMINAVGFGGNAVSIVIEK